MDTLPITAARKAQLESYAQRHGQDTATALDDILANYFELEQEAYRESVEAISRGYEDIKAGRTRPASEFFEELRIKHALPR